LDEVNFGPQVAVEAIDVLAAEVDNTSGNPVGRQEPHGEQNGAARSRVEVVGAIGLAWWARLMPPAKTLAVR